MRRATRRLALTWEEGLEKPCLLHRMHVGPSVGWVENPALPRMQPRNAGIVIAAYDRLRRRRALLTTDTDDKLIASAAIIGESVTPNDGYNTPAAKGTPSAL